VRGCGARFTTFERVQLRDLTVVKKDGKREPFDRAKLERAIGHACRKRDIDAGKIDRLVSGIQRQMETRGDEVDRRARIGEAVMAGLKALDHVAYIRFASIYKDFSDPATSPRSPSGWRRKPRRPRRRATTNCCEPKHPLRLKPVIVLVRPQLGQNIGKAARAMLNFGLTELRLVAPRDGWPNPDAGPAASGADVVLEQAQVFDTSPRRSPIARSSTPRPCAAATSSCRWSARGNGARDARLAGRSAILFGPSARGSRPRRSRSPRKIVTVPINPDFGSLNLAQAVILLAYEWSKRRGAGQPTVKAIRPSRGRPGASSRA
jgi:transcriptional regulator NrdR